MKKPTIAAYARATSVVERSAHVDGACIVNAAKEATMLATPPLMKRIVTDLNNCRAAISVGVRFI